jgi:hypothetical protein
MADVLVEQGVDVLYPDGERVMVRLRVWDPVTNPAGGATCAVYADGLRAWPWDVPYEMPGVSAFHALAQGLQFLYGMLAIDVSRGAVLHLEGDPQRAIPLDALFARRRLRGRGGKRQKGSGVDSGRQ